MELDREQVLVDKKQKPLTNEMKEKIKTILCEKQIEKMTENLKDALVRNGINPKTDKKTYERALKMWEGN